MFDKKDEFEWFKFCPQTRSEIKRKGESLDLVLWQGTQWAVTEYGLEKRDGTYHVQAKDMWTFATPMNSLNPKTKQSVFVHWFKHLSSKSWCDEDDIDHALQAFMLLFDEKGKRTHITPPTFIGESEVEEYVANCANDEYEAARRRAIEGMVFYAS